MIKVIIDYCLENYLDYKCLICGKTLQIKHFKDWIYLYGKNQFCSLQCYFFI